MNAHQRGADLTPSRPRRDRLCEERQRDPYLSRRKHREPTVCTYCGAVFHQGRWQWLEADCDAEKHPCPACRRIRDHLPAGVLTLRGDYFLDHKDELLHLIRHTEERESSNHPMERIIEIEESNDGRQTVITFTGIHLTRGVGAALRHAHQGEFNYSYTERDDVLRASWER